MCCGDTEKVTICGPAGEVVVASIAVADGFGVAVANVRAGVDVRVATGAVGDKVEGSCVEAGVGAFVGLGVGTI